MVRYSGVFAPGSKLRSQIVPRPQPAEEANSDSIHPTRRKRITWSKLMARVFEIDVYECPRCKSQMQTISFVMDSQSVRDILKCLKLPTAPPEIAGSSFREDQTDIYYDYDFAD